MPKAIEGAHEAILAAAGHLLAAEGYDRLNIRAIAAESGLATGTIYNYYRAKDEIVFALMMKDWETTIGRLDSLVGSAEAQSAGGKAATLLWAFFETMHGFISKYTPVWRLMALVPHEKKSPQLRNYRTEDFVGSLEERVTKILTAQAGEGSSPEEIPPMASLITRVFSVFVMDTEPDRASMELLLRKLLRT